MYYSILRYFNDKLDLSSLLNEIIDYSEKHNKNLNIEKIKDFLVKYYNIKHNTGLTRQKQSDLSNKLLRYIQK